MTASNGKEAVEVFQTEKDSIDIVILDMIMPNMSGSETFDELRKIKPDTQVLLSSGYSLDNQAEEIMNRGCNGFLQKPFNLQELSQKLRDTLISPT